MDKTSNQTKTLNQIKEEIENISQSVDTLSVTQIISLIKQTMHDLNKIKLEEDNEG